METIDDLAARLDRVEAELALHRLVAEYCIGADHRDLERWAAVWTADAVWEPDPASRLVGREAICGAVQHQWRAFPIMHHVTGNHVVDIDGDRATGRADVVAMIQTSDGRWILAGATYRDDYRRHGGAWRIARRRVHRPFDLAPLDPSRGPIRDDTGASGIGGPGMS